MTYMFFIDERGRVWCNGPYTGWQLVDFSLTFYG